MPAFLHTVQRTVKTLNHALVSKLYFLIENSIINITRNGMISLNKKIVSYKKKKHRNHTESVRVISCFFF